MESGYSHTWSWGRSNEFTKTWSAKFPVKAAPGKTVRAVSTVTRGELEVPYTIVSKGTMSGKLYEMHGTWRGVSTWDLTHSLSLVEDKVTELGTVFVAS